MEEKDLKFLLNNINDFLCMLEIFAEYANFKQEARLSATILDVCEVHEISELSSEQKECIIKSVRVLMIKWGRLNRFESNEIRSKILEAGLTWLPVTDNAQKEIEEARKMLDSLDANKKDK